MKSNINDELVLPATVVASKSGSVRWSLSGSPFINIHESAISLTEFAISPFVPTMIFYTDLILPSNLLSAGVWYTFTLTFYPDDKSLEVYSSSVTIKTNRGPQPGVFSVSPNQGEAFVTLYLMSATFWDSPHLPLRYSFGYFSEDALAISLQVGEYPTKATRLPAGRVERAYGLTCIVTVLDKLGFYSVMNRSVIVNPTTLNGTDLIEILDAELPPEVVQAVLDVNCSLAPSCASLNRRNCSSMAHTCGACLSLQYVGVIGSSNTQCVIIEEVLEPDDVIPDINITNSTTDSTTDGVIDWECFDNSMCSRFKICEGFRCLPVAKACPIHCPSDRGACAYITTATSLVVDRCYVGDTACVAVCRCVEGWSGPTCSVDYEELEQATFLVSDILCTLAKEAIFASESKRIESADVALWVSQLRFLSQESSSLRLSADSAICTMTVLTIILENSLLVNMTLSQLQVMWDTMDVLLHFKQYFDYSVISLFPYHKELTGNMSSTLQLFCQTVHLLPEPTIPVLSKQNNLLLKLETNLTSPSSLDICHTVSPIAFMERKGPLSSDFCAVRCEPQVFNVNLTMMLESEVLEVKPPATINDTAELIISVACVADTSPPTLSPRPPPPRAFCELDDISWKELLCANGTAAISCNGLASYNVSCIDVNHIFSFDCPHLYCVVVEKISDMMCQCSLPVSDRFVSVSIGAVIISVAQDFHATLSGADVLSERGKWKTVVTLTLIVLLFALGLWIVHMVDRSQALRVARDIQEREQRDREMIDLEKDEERIAMLQSTFVARDVYATFPSIFNKDSMSEVFVGELKKSHRWASLLFHYHPQRPRSLRFVVLTTLVTCTLFLNALFFKVSHYELDHDCEQFLSQQKCTEETSPFSTTTSKCFWEHQDHSCYSKQLDSEVSALWLMMLAVAVFSIPIVIILELAVDWVLVRPTASGGCLSQKLSSVFPAPETLSNCLGATIEGGDSHVPGEEKVVNGSLYDFVDLISLVIDYRTSLSVNDCKVFDKRWGFPSTLHSIDMDLELDMYLKHLRTREAEADGRVNLYDDAERNDVFVEGPLFAVFDQILEEIKHSRLYASREIHLLNHISEQNKGKRLLELFQKDLLIGVKVDIVTNLRYEDKLEDTSDCVLRPIHVWVKALCLSVIATINIFFLTYVFLFSMNQDMLGQAAFLRVFCMWLAVEVIVVSTLSMVVTRMLLPLWATYWEAAKAKQGMLRAIRKAFTQSTDVVPQPSSSSSVIEGRTRGLLNLCPYFFLSHRVAVAYPKLRESRVVRSFRSSYPKQAFALPTRAYSREHSLKFIGLALLNSINTFVLYTVSGFVNSFMGYQIVSVINWCLLGYISSLKDNVFNTGGAGGVTAMVFLWLVFLYMLNDMIGRANAIFKEQNDLTKKIHSMKKVKRFPPEQVVPEETIGTVKHHDASHPIELRDESHSEFKIEANFGSKYVEFPKHKPAALSEALRAFKDKCNQSDRRDDSNESITDVEMVHILARHLQLAHRELVDALVEDEGEKRVIFEHEWDKKPDEYRLLYYPSVRPYEDSTGRSVTLIDIATARRLAEEKDRREFRRETDLARKRAEREWEWDQYRLYESEQVLPFVSRNGELIDADSIREKRALAQGTDTKGWNWREKRHPTIRVEKCLKNKQLIEHELLLSRERAESDAEMYAMVSSNAKLLSGVGVDKITHTGKWLRKSSGSNHSDSSSGSGRVSECGSDDSDSLRTPGWMVAAQKLSQCDVLPGVIVSQQSRVADEHVCACASASGRMNKLQVLPAIGAAPLQDSSDE
jgi:hypothetical protein